VHEQQKKITNPKKAKIKRQFFREQARVESSLRKPYVKPKKGKTTRGKAY